MRPPSVASGFRYPRYQDCPDADVLHFERAHPEKMSKVTGLPIGGQRRYHQRRCPTCGYWVMWEEK